MSDATQKLIRMAQVNLIALQNQRIAQLEIEVEKARERVRELEAMAKLAKAPVKGDC